MFNTFLNTVVGVPLGYLMRMCLTIVGNYGLAIILFTLFTKIILFPLNIMIQKNSIKMIRIQPELNEISAKYVGNQDRISEEQLKLYTRENYRPLAGLVPMMIQVPLVLGVMQVIYNPLQHLLRIPKDVISAFVGEAIGVLHLQEAGSSIQVNIVNLIQNTASIEQFRALQIGNYDIPGIVSRIQEFDMTFLGINMSVTPQFGVWNILTWVPVLAGASSYLLCFCQNHVNVLQKEQGWLGKWGMAIFLVLFSGYFAYIVPAGVGLYWTASNLFAILVMYAVNWLYKPKKYIDYEALEKSKIALAQSKEVEKSLKLTPEAKARAKADYKAFFKDEEKKLVFYSEKSGFYKYFQNVIEYILEHSDITIHYITSDFQDAIFKKDNPRIKPYFIDDNRLIPLFMKMDADKVVMTTPDLQTFHLKRSYVRKDVEYIYMFHGLLSTNMVVNKGAYDNFDTIFCVGQHQIDEIRETEKMYQLPEKRLIECGYGLFDNMVAEYENGKSIQKSKRQILIAPSWQEGNILDTCIGEILDRLMKTGYEIIVRPHPEYIKRFPSEMNQLLKRYEAVDNVVFQTDFSSNNTVFDADLLMTDWSGIAYEFSYVTKRPSLFINTKMKVLNEDWDKYENAPLDITLRDRIGVSLEPDQLDDIALVVERLLNEEQDKYILGIQEIVSKYVFNIGHSGEVGGQYIIDSLN